MSLVQYPRNSVMPKGVEHPRSAEITPGLTKRRLALGLGLTKVPISPDAMQLTRR